MHARCAGKRYLEGSLHCLLSTGHGVRLNYEVTSANVDFQLFVGLAFQDSQTHYLPSDTLTQPHTFLSLALGKGSVYAASAYNFWLYAASYHWVASVDSHSRPMVTLIRNTLTVYSQANFGFCT